MEKKISLDVIIKEGGANSKESCKLTIDVGTHDLKAGILLFSKVREALDTNLKNWNKERKAFNFVVDDEVIMKKLEKIVIVEANKDGRYEILVVLLEENDGSMNPQQESISPLHLNDREIANPVIRRKSSIHVDHKYYNVILSFFVVFSSAIIGSVILAVAYSLTFVYNKSSAFISILLFDSVARYSAYAATYYLAYPEAFVSNFYFRLFWWSLFILYASTDFLYYLAIPSNLNGQIVPRTLPEYWVSCNAFMQLIGFGLFLGVFAYNRKGNPKSTPSTGFKYFMSLSIVNFFLIFFVTFLTIWDISVPNVVTMTSTLLLVPCAVLYTMIYDLKKNLSFDGYYLYGLIVLANYTLQLLGYIPILITSSMESPSEIKTIFIAIGIQMFSFVLLRGGEKTAEMGSSEKQKFALLLPIYLQISLIQLTPYFDGGLLLQSSSNSSTFVKLFLIHQISDFFKNSGLGSFAWYLCKLLAGYEAENPYADVKHIENLLMRGALDISCEGFATITIITIAGVEGILQSNIQNTNVRLNIISKENNFLSITLTLLIILLLRLLFYSVTRLFFKRAHAVSLRIGSVRVVPTDNLPQTSSRSSINPVFENQISLKNMFGKVFHGQEILIIAWMLESLFQFLDLGGINNT